MMTSRSPLSPAAAALSLVWIGGQVANGAVLWNEGVDGDLPGDFNSPQTLVVTPGENTFSGRVGENGNTGATDGSDADYLTIMVPDGLEVISLSVQRFEFAVGDPGGGSFLAYRSGSGFAGQGFGDIDTWTLFFDSPLNLLPDLGQNSLGAGQHAFWLQETNPTLVEYVFSIQTVPEPGVGALGGIAALLVVGRRRRI
ncbi:MAG: hypothetical protein CMN05_16335 [Roseibacillus sp.]|jgi:hypothetical protein|nr:hypothetical protein [Roseibacillus sp.]MBP36730.1 hypothetical protein [Roseibacillus sp.]MDP6209387.1 hypothetical protein [Roseibacillus sp.]MDP7106230.1 hypothetical protein [Roseibacillus sp.]MDP7308802.1 hypothetical protein [Roseibacillus sp.]|tara:strand:- start:6120 stop:6713 length:594 start_codon:yes stop_codon:yes gene_type:complete